MKRKYFFYKNKALSLVYKNKEQMIYPQRSESNIKVTKKISHLISKY